MKFFSFVVLFLIAAVPYAGAVILINEVDADQTGTDSAEFVELYNTAGTPVDLGAGAYVLVLYNGNGDVSYGAYDLTGTIGGNDYFVIGTSTVPNVDLSPSGWPATNAVQNGADAVALYSGTSAAAFPAGTAVTATNLVDAVVYGTADPDDTGLLTVLTPGQPQVDESANASPETQSIQRVPDGAGGALNTGSYVADTPTPGTENGAVAPTDVANIAEARALGDGALVRITGVVTVTTATNGLNAGRNQLTVQDDSGADGQSAVLVDDPAYALGVDYALGDQIQNLSGTLTSFYGMLELVPSGPATLVGPGSPPAPILVDTFVINFESIEAELVQVDGASVAETGTWAANTNYNLTSPLDIIIGAIRIEDNSTAVGAAIPSGTFNLIGITVEFSIAAEPYQIQPRFDTDIGVAAFPTPPPATGVESWEVYR